MYLLDHHWKLKTRFIFLSFPSRLLSEAIYLRTSPALDIIYWVQGEYDNILQVQGVLDNILGTGCIGQYTG